MADRAAKKHRKELQRKQKARQSRKLATAGPWKAIAAGAGDLQVWWNPNWRETRQASIFAFRTLKSGSVLGSMLVDLGMPGLKDAWQRSNISSEEMRRMFDTSADAGVSLERCDPEEAMRLVRGAIRFAFDNGFRLPRNYERVVSILGVLGDWHIADVSDFMMEFAGSTDDLRRRLIGQSLEDFLERDDVEIILNDDAPSLLRDEEQYKWQDSEEAADEASLRKAFDEIRSKAIESVSQWCEANGETPSPQLGRAVELFFTSMATAALSRSENGALTGGDNAEAEGDDLARDVFGGMREALLAEREPDRELLRQAVEQFTRVAASRSSKELSSILFPSP